MNWKDFLTAAEVEELAKIQADKAAGQKQAKRIYDRCWRRLKKQEAVRHG